MPSPVSDTDSMTYVSGRDFELFALQDIDTHAIEAALSNRPPPGIASRALMTRFIKICSNCPGSISTSCGGSA